MKRFRYQLPAVADADAAERLEAALSFAQSAGALLRAHIEKRGDSESTLQFKGRRDLVTAADRASEKFLVEAVRDAFPSDAVLAEEGVASPAGRADREAAVCWTIDPLDGTTNFVHGHPNYCVSLGILREGRPWIGVVHAPALGGVDGGEFYYGIAGESAWCNGRRLRVTPTRLLADALVATGFAYIRNEPGVNTNLANFGRVVMEVRGIRRCGSAALDIAHVAAGVYDAYWEMYLSPHDVAAGIALVLGAGGEVRPLSAGGDPVFDQEVLATNGCLTEALLPYLEGKPS